MATNTRRNSARTAAAAAALAPTPKATPLAKATKLFYAPEGEPIRVALADGRIAVIGEEPRELQQCFWRAATRAGALTADGLTAAELAGPKPDANSDPLERAENILQAVLEAARSPEDEPGFETAFNGDGKPNVRWLENRLGIQLDAGERDAAWVQAQAVLDAEEEKGDPDADDDEKPDALIANKAALNEKGGTFADVE